MTFMNGENQKKKKPIVQFSKLGKCGRFGNQLYQYAFIRKYSELTHSKLETGKWIGQSIFENIRDPLPSKKLKLITSKNFLTPEHQKRMVNIDSTGQYQCQCHLIYSLDWVRNLYRFNKKTLDFLGKPEISDYAAIHVRRGDYVSSGEYCIVSESSYEKLLNQLNVKDVIWIYREDDVTDIHHKRFKYSKYNEFSKTEKMLMDFWYLMNSKVLIRSNSTFSVWAGFLHRGEKIYSPDVNTLVGLNDVEFVEGNTCRCTKTYTDFELK